MLIKGIFGSDSPATWGAASPRHQPNSFPQNSRIPKIEQNLMTKAGTRKRSWKIELIHPAPSRSRESYRPHVLEELRRYRHGPALSHAALNVGTSSCRLRGGTWGGGVVPVESDMDERGDGGVRLIEKCQCPDMTTWALIWDGGCHERFRGY